MRYLDPKADLTFQRVFGEHPDLVMSLLNALLPLEDGQEITNIEYLPTEMVPNNPLRYKSIIDVRCKDKQDRQFIVEMQIIWSPEYQQRVFFEDSKAYACQADADTDYHLPQPVYSLYLVNDAFRSKLEGFYHYYKTVHIEDTDKTINNLHLVFIELPKFQPNTNTGRKMQTLWLHFLTGIKDNSLHILPELLTNEQIKKAVMAIEESEFSYIELLGHEKFWDAISVERTLYYSAWRRGFERGRIEVNAARIMKEKGASIDFIIDCTGLTAEQIETL